MPSTLKRISCDVLAIFLYMPFVLTARFFNLIGMKKFARKIPLSDYINKSFFIIRNDALDRFGTKLEQRFSKKEVQAMMEGCGLNEIVISPSSPFYHAIGKKR